MNSRFQGLLIALGVGMVGSVYAKHDVYLKVDKTVDYDFNIYGKLKNDRAAHIFLEKKGDQPVLLGNLNDMVIDSFSLATPKLQGFYQFKGFSGILTGAHKHMGSNANKDYQIVIKAVGGRIGGKWDVKGEWIADQTYAPVPAKLINASDWNLEIQYTEEPMGGYREMTEYLIKQDQSKVNFVELADASVLEGMKLKGKHAAPGTWTGWATVGAFDSTAESIATKISAAKSKIKDWNIETLAIIVKHVGRVTGGGFVGRAWDVEVTVVKQSDKIEDLAKGYTVGSSTGTPATPGKGAGKQRAPALTALTTAGDHQVAIQNNSSEVISVSFKQGSNPVLAPATVSKLNNYLIKDADLLTELTLTVPGFSTYNAMPMIMDAMKHLDKTLPQYVILNVRNVGKTPESWVVKAEVRSYTKTSTGAPKIERKKLTYKHGGKVKQK